MFYFRPFLTLTLALLGTQAIPTQAQAPLEDPPDLPATGNIQDLKGLENREVSDWFSPANTVPSPLDLNPDTYRLNQKDSPLLPTNDQDWIRETPGEPKSSGGGVPLGTF